MIRIEPVGGQVASSADVGSAASLASTAPVVRAILLVLVALALWLPQRTVAVEAPLQAALPSDAPERWLLGFLDVETTGLTPGYHEMIDIGLILTDLEGVEVARLFRRVLPPHPERLSPGAAAVNGFSTERWEQLGAEPVEAVVEEVSRFVRSAADGRMILLTAYNVWFDAAFLDHLYRAADRDWRELQQEGRVSYHLLDLPSMAWSMGYRQVYGAGLPEALGIEPEVDDPMLHTGLTGAEFNLLMYRRLLQLADD